jgi:valyl-tRNA synthetase
MNKEIPKIYSSKEHEDLIYALWEKSGFFNPDKIKSTKRYCNVLPPPNANGELHLGHATGYTVMDIFGRFERMQGKKVLLYPGKDHAGIQSQYVYEKKIREERGISRHELGREKFYKEMYAFCIDRSQYMRNQEKKIGLGADWSREKFTLDPEVLEIALDTFVKMHRDGLIYRGERIINWCPSCSTALSDVEVIHEETSGKIYYIKYPLKQTRAIAASEYITVATTRPETMLGDTAIAVNPKDKRYARLVGKAAILPLQNREIPIIADRRVEMEFGTGMVKVTPAHDPLDWQIGQDHGLPEIQVINEKAQISKLGGKYQGQDVLEARKNILNDLTELGLLEKEENHSINKSACERCKAAIEPLISKQWFIAVDGKKYSLKKESLKAIKAGKIKFYPESFRKIMISWLSNLHDWCISRQIWWGPRIPVWYCDKCGEEKYIVSIKKPVECPHCRSKKLRQEEDTFDTWFSSGQWVHTTLGYPKSKDYKAFYQSDMMVTGRDLLFFWASKMIMLSLYRTGKVPFQNLYFTGLAQDKDGKKMSKSKGNGIDPLEMIEKYGADAMRLALVMDTTPGQDFRLFEAKIESFRNFVSKLWNIYRYAVSSDSEFELVDKIVKKDVVTLSDRWIIGRLEETKKNVTDFLKKRDISEAQGKLRTFLWDDLADWYLEIHKVEKNTKVLGYVLNNALKLYHPFAPFVTEKIWQDLFGGNRILMVEKWPVIDERFLDKNSQSEFSSLREVVTKIRNIRTNYHIDPGQTIQAYAKKIDNREVLEKLARIKVDIMPKGSFEGVTVAGKNIKLILAISDLIDVEKEKARLEKEIANLEGLIIRTDALLKNKNFTKSAPKDIIANNKTKLKEYREKLKIQKGLLENLS